MDPSFIDIAKTWGLPLAMTFFAVLSGARGWWYYKTYVEYMQKIFEERLQEKNDLITHLQAQNTHNSQVSSQALDLAQRQSDILLRIESELKVRRREKAGDQ